MTELINLFVDQHRLILSIPTTRRQVAHQTYQGRNPDDESDEKPLKPGRKGICPCRSAPDDGDHDFEQCSYINPLVRPKGWKPNEKAQKALKRRCQTSPAFKKAYQHAMKKHQKSDESNNKSAETDEAADSNDEETTKREAFSAYIPKQQANDIFRDDSKAMSTIWVQAKKNDTWCYDTGASIHVTNNRDLLSNYRPIVSSVMVGNTETTILGYGELTVHPTKSLDGSSFPLKHVAYCPGFHINLISAERATNAGIYLNGKKCMLEEKNGKPICKLNSTSGIYLIKWDENTDTGRHTANHVSPSPISYSSLTTVSHNDVSSIDTISHNDVSHNDNVSPLTNQFSKVALSSHTKKQLIGTIDQWHRRLGHIGRDIISHLPEHASNVNIKDISSPLSYCEAYKLANSPRQISR